MSRVAQKALEWLPPDASGGAPASGERVSCTGITNSEEEDGGIFLAEQSGYLNRDLTGNVAGCSMPLVQLSDQKRLCYSLQVRAINLAPTNQLNGLCTPETPDAVRLYQGVKFCKDFSTDDTDMPNRLTTEIINAAILGFESQKEQLDAQIQELRQLLDGKQPEQDAAIEATPRRRKRFSAASRRKMALAQKARWAKIKGESGPETAAAAPVKPKRKLSAAGRKAIQQALRKRWAQAAKAKKAAPARKKAAVKKAAKKAVPAAPAGEVTDH